MSRRLPSTEPGAGSRAPIGVSCAYEVHKHPHARALVLGLGAAAGAQGTSAAARRPARDRLVFHLLQHGSRARVQSRGGPAALVRIRARHRRLHDDAQGRSVLRDGRVGHRLERMEQPVRRRHPCAGAADARARCRRARADAGSEDRPRARLRGGRVAVVHVVRHGRTADAAGGVPGRDGDRRPHLRRRLGGEDFLRAVDLRRRRGVASRSVMRSRSRQAPFSKN